jgi:hypothetical protein
VNPGRGGDDRAFIERAVRVGIIAGVALFGFAFFSYR